MNSKETAKFVVCVALLGSLTAAGQQSVSTPPVSPTRFLPNLYRDPDLGIAAVALLDSSYTFDTAEQHRLRVVVVAKGLKHPYAVALLPNGDALVSERSGPLRLVHNAAGAGGAAAELDPEPVAGIPSLVPFYSHGGLQDVVLHPKFAANRWVYFLFNRPDRPPPAGAKPPVMQKSILSVWRGKLSESGFALSEVKQLFATNPSGTGGSRMAFGKDGLLYFTTGAPFDNQAQQLDTDFGKVLRIRDDGQIPADNPFVTRSDARPEIYSYGHRDQGGLAVDPKSGGVYSAEFGPNGGDKINWIQSGRNYGWPLVSFGREYAGPRWSTSPWAEGTELPLVVWLPSISPFGLVFYDGDKFPKWKGNLFTGSVQRGEIPHTGGLERVVFNDHMEEIRRESMLTELHQRIGDVRQGPDGLLYLLTDEDDGALLRLEPAH